MTNSFYNPSGTPGTGTFAASAPMRSEFNLIADGFDLLPTLSGGTASKAVVVNPSGTGLTTTTGTLALAGNFTTTGAFSLALIAGASVNLTLPLVSGTLATLAGTETLSNKTLVAPALGAATATSINRVTITAPATSATLTIADGKTLTVNAALTLTGTDSTVMTFPSTSATIARTDAANTFTGIQTFSTPIASASLAVMTATVGGRVPTPPNDATKFLRGDATWSVPTYGTMSSGSAASPGLPFAVDSTTGFYASTAAPYGNTLNISVEGVEQAQFIRRDAGTVGYENTWLLLGSGTAVTNETTDTYIATLGVQSFDWSGTASRPVPFNFGTVHATITDTITKTGLPVMGELDKLDIYQSGGAVTVNRAMGWRVRSPIPHPGVTIGQTICLGFTDPSLAISGTVTNHNYIELPPTVGSANGPTTTIGMFYNDKPNGGSVATDGGVEYWINGGGVVTINGSSSSDINITAGTGSNSGNLTLKGADVSVDTRINSSRVRLKSAGDTVIEVGSTSAANYLVVEANSNVLLRPNHASTANLSIGVSSKGNGSVTFYTNNAAEQQVEITHTASAVNRIQMTGAASGANPQIRASGENLILGLGSALLTSATAGHIMIPSCAGTPTGAVTGAATGAIPLIYDTSANKLWALNGGTWRSVALT